MDTPLKRKVGIALAVLGGLLLVGFRWAGPAILVIGALLVIVGVILALRDDSKVEGAKWVHDTTHAPDDD
jgi:hypothetical protein